MQVQLGARVNDGFAITIRHLQGEDDRQQSLRCCPPILEGQLKAGYLDHIGVKTAPPHITPARGPPLWDGADAQAGKGVEPAPDWGQECQAEPDFEVDQRISW